MKKAKRTFVEMLRFSVSSWDCTLLSSQILIGITLSVLALFLAAKLGEDVLSQETIRFDAPILSWMHAQRTPVYTQFMLFSSQLGSQGILVLAILSVIALSYKHHRRDAVIFLSILLVGVGLNLALKSAFVRPRPSLDPLVLERSYSFPSGHAMNSTIFYASLSYFVFRRIKRQRLRQSLLMGCIVIIGLIGLSRVYLGVHYPSDVLAGYAIGLLWFLMVLLFSRILRFYRLFCVYRCACE